MLLLLTRGLQRKTMPPHEFKITKTLQRSTTEMNACYFTMNFFHSFGALP